ncbi:MAG: type VI secretion protein ImpB [Pseudomonadota bacterium]
MRQPETIESLYLDFDGFFASVMQQAFPRLRGRPVGVVPFDVSNAKHTAVIACSKEAKALGVSNVMRVPDALSICPELVLVSQRPDLFRRAHNALLNEIHCVLPIETIKSIDELSCTLSPTEVRHPKELAANIKARLADNVGEHVTCSIGMAPNRLLAKIACKVGKPNGVTIWPPECLPGPLLKMTFEDVPGIGTRMEKRLNAAGIWTLKDLLETAPKQMRGLWRSVNGERLWYSLHGYHLHAQTTKRGMFGHARVLPPDWRSIERALSTSRLLLTKAARRMRRENFYAGKLWLWLDVNSGGWFGQRNLHFVNDDQACLSALMLLWEQARAQSNGKLWVFRVGVTLVDLVPANNRQLDLFLADDAERRRWEALTNSIDALNARFGKRVVTIGPWTPPPGDYAGGKIAFNRIPDEEDFW